MDILDENNDHVDIGLIYEEQMNTYTIPDDTVSFSNNPTGDDVQNPQPEEPSNEFNAQVYEVIKEVELNFSDELAELDYEGNPQGVIKFIKQLTAEVVKFNAQR